jgi:ParB family chromosome partitioning protein
MEKIIVKDSETGDKLRQKKGLGRGLGALMPNIELSNRGEEQLSNIIAEINVSEIRVNRFQPRQDFDEKKLDELKQSIEKHGLITPISVRRVASGYELISGERRYRAVQMLKMPKIFAFILDVDSDVEMLEKAIIENIQREDLNPIEEANAYNRLIEECNLTQEQVAEVVGKDRSTITNMLRLLKLPITIQDYVRDKVLTMGHARALLSLESYEDMIVTAQNVIEKQFSVRETEKLVKRLIEKSDPTFKPINTISTSTKTILNDAASKLMHIMGTQVKIVPKTEEVGKIEIEYYSVEDFQRIIELIDKEISN